MKIVSLTAENVKKLVAVQIRPDGNLVQICGKNGQGKTSVLDSIWWALTGTSHIQAAPIRAGANQARIRLDLGDLVVTRTFRRQDGLSKLDRALLFSFLFHWPRARLRRYAPGDARKRRVSGRLSLRGGWYYAHQYLRSLFRENRDGGLVFPAWYES